MIDVLMNIFDILSIIEINKSLFFDLLHFCLSQYEID